MATADPEVQSSIGAGQRQLDERELESPKRKIDIKWFLIGNETKQNTSRHCPTIRTIAFMMDMCPIELGRCLVLQSDRCDTRPKVKSAIRDCVEQVRHMSYPMEIDEMSHRAEDEHDGE